LKEKISCYRDGLKINGPLFLPKTHKNERLPIAIVCHEFMANQLCFFPYRQAAAAAVLYSCRPRLQLRTVLQLCACHLDILQ